MASLHDLVSFLAGQGGGFGLPVVLLDWVALQGAGIVAERSPLGT